MNGLIVTASHGFLFDYILMGKRKQSAETILISRMKRSGWWILHCIRRKLRRRGKKMERSTRNTLVSRTCFIIFYFTRIKIDLPSSVSDWLSFYWQVFILLILIPYGANVTREAMKLIHVIIVQLCLSVGLCLIQVIILFSWSCVDNRHFRIRWGLSNEFW